jgi:excisionase family DNA binding protein
LPDFVADLPCLAFSCARATSQADMLVYPFGNCRDNDSYGGQLPMANKKMIVDEKRYSDIPVWRRYTLTIEEAAGYYHIGEGKLRMLIDTHPNEDFYMMNGNRVLIKREKFERYLDRATAV